MKSCLLIVITLFMSRLSSFSDDVFPRGAIDIKNAPITQVLALYKDLTGTELVTDSRVKTVKNEVTLVANPTRRDEAARLLEKALLEQAGIVITRLDDKRASVTYNDALPISQPKKPSKI